MTRPAGNGFRRSSEDRSPRGASAALAKFAAAGEPNTKYALQREPRELLGFEDDEPESIGGLAGTGRDQLAGGDLGEIRAGERR